MNVFIKRFLLEETAQDLIEYTLLLGFIVLGSAALYIGAGKNVSGVWDENNEVLEHARRVIR